MAQPLVEDFFFCGFPYTEILTRRKVLNSIIPLPAPISNLFDSFSFSWTAWLVRAVYMWWAAMLSGLSVMSIRWSSGASGASLA